MSVCILIMQDHFWRKKKKYVEAYLRFAAQHLGKILWEQSLIRWEQYLTLWKPGHPPCLEGKKFTKHHPKSTKPTWNVGGWNIMVWGCVPAYRTGKLNWKKKYAARNTWKEINTKLRKYLTGFRKENEAARMA